MENRLVLGNWLKDLEFEEIAAEQTAGLLKEFGNSSKDIVNVSGTFVIVFHDRSGRRNSSGK